MRSKTVFQRYAGQYILHSKIMYYVLKYCFKDEQANSTVLKQCFKELQVNMHQVL